MTKKEAIEFFKEQKEIFGKECLMNEAIDKAIESLEKENVIYNYGYDDGYKDGYKDGKNIACLDIFDMVEQYKEQEED